MYGQYGYEPRKVQQTPFSQHVIDTIPGLPTSIGMLANRTSNSILYGTRGKNMMDRWPFRNMNQTNWRGNIARGLSEHNYLSPKRWLRTPNLDYMHTDTAFSGLKSKAYSPYGFADIINGSFRKRAAGDGKVASAITKAGGVSSEDFITKGFMGRMTAGFKVANMSEAKFNRYNSMIGRGRNARNFLGQSGLANMSQSTMSSSLMLSGTGTFTSGISGFFAGMNAPLNSQFGGGFYAAGLIDDMAEKVRPGEAARMRAMKGADLATRFADDIGLKGAGSTIRSIGTRQIMSAAANAGRGANLATRAAMMGKGAALAGGRLAGMAIPGLNVIMTALLVKDIAKLGAHAVGKGAALAASGYKSYQGGLNTKMMDQGYADTEAAATSRARGVMAIQNSRLNARSVLGSEAGMMAAHFG